MFMPDDVIIDRSTDTMPKLSVLIPVLNEADSLVELHAELAVVADQRQYVMEFIFVDDGSTDDSWEMIQQLAAKDERVQGLRFRRNFGKASALRAAAAISTGPMLISMDADLQDDPQEIPSLLDKMGEEYDLVSGWKATRRDPISKTLPSKIFNMLVGWMTGVKLHDHNCGFKIYRREIFDDVKLYGEMHRFVPVLAAAHGYRLGEVAVSHRPRSHGKSKYGWSRLPKGFLDLLTVSFLAGYNQRPQHLLGAIGLSSFCLGALGMFWMAIYWVLRMTYFHQWQPLHQRPVVIYSLRTLLLGAQLLCMGFLAELIVAKGQERNEPYSIRERV